MPAIEISSLRHVYADGHVALADINLKANDGEFLALLGPSGSGKTTLLRSIAGFLRPEAGSLRIGGETVAGDGAWLPPEQRKLGMVFQNHAIWPHWSVARNVGYPLKLAGVPRTEAAQRVQAVLDQVGLGELGARNPAALSGGQRQRVALARAIVAAPRALLLDEALSSLDEPLRARLRLELKSLTREQSLTTIHVTHDRAEALALADKVAVLNAGRIEQVDTPAQLLRRPSTAFVASFVSDATVFEATLGSGFLVLQAVGAAIPADRLRLVGFSAAHALSAVNRRAEAAVCPSDVRLEKLSSPTNDGAVITSALYGQHGFDVLADWNGVPLRAHVTDWLPRAGDMVKPVIKRVHVYPPAESGAPRRTTGVPRQRAAA